jgi:hypothetical protein
VPACIELGSDADVVVEDGVDVVVDVDVVDVDVVGVDVDVDDVDGVVVVVPADADTAFPLPDEPDDADPARWATTG